MFVGHGGTRAPVDIRSRTEQRRSARLEPVRRRMTEWLRLWRPNLRRQQRRSYGLSWENGQKPGFQIHECGQGKRGLLDFSRLSHFALAVGAAGLRLFGGARSAAAFDRLGEGRSYENARHQQCQSDSNQSLKLHVVLLLSLCSGFSLLSHHNDSKGPDVPDFYCTD